MLYKWRDEIQTVNILELRPKMKLTSRNLYTQIEGTVAANETLTAHKYSLTWNRTQLLAL